MGGTIQVLDPSTGAAGFELEPVAADAIDPIVARAAAAQREWAALPALERGNRLRSIAAKVREDGELVELVCADVGKPRAEAAAEVLRGAQIFEYVAGLGALPSGELFEDSAGGQVRVVRHPRGVVALVTPWNFPVAIPAWKLAPALLTGNAVVVKPSTPATRIGNRLLELVAAELPEGCCQVAAGGGDVARALIAADIDMVSFTGSTEVGRSIHAALGGRMVPLQLEMGGKNALYVSAAADPGFAADVAVAGAMGYAGQKCTATSRVYVDGEVAEEFRQALVAAVDSLVVGDARDEKTAVGPMISAAAVGDTVAAVEAAVGRGLGLLRGGGALDRDGFFMAPTVLDGGAPDDPIVREELFAPVLAIQAVAGIEEALERIGATEYGLAAGIVSPLREEVERFVSSVQAGVVRVNAPTTGLEVHVPFGGVAESSFGPREQGLAGIDAFTETRTIYG